MNCLKREIETSTKYTPDKISTVAKDKDGKQTEINMTPTDIQHRIDKSEVNQSAEKIESKVGNTAVGITDGKCISEVKMRPNLLYWDRNLRN